MAMKYETWTSTAKKMESFEIIKCAYGKTEYRGVSYDVPEMVTILDRDRFTQYMNQRQTDLEAHKEDMAKGVYGSGSKVKEAIYALDFMTKVLAGEFRRCPETPVAKPIEASVQAAEAPVVSNQAGLDVLAQVVAEVVSRSAGAEVVEKISEQAISMVRKFIADEYGPIQKRVEVVTPAGEVKPVEGMVHEAFDEVLAYVQADEPVFLVGPAGCGKNVLCKQVAEALGLEFYFSNAVTQEYKITGFTDAMGVYQESQFYKAFTKGGLFFLDEMDASIPEVLLILNSAIANRYFDFPAPIGRVEAHPDFRVVSAGNTVGQGASFEYVGRNQLDASSLDRFAVVKVGYDRKVELSVAGGDSELVEFIHKVREACETCGVSLITSYRSIGRIAKMSKALPLDKVLRSCLFKGMSDADLATIRNGVIRVGAENKYIEVLKTL